MPIDTISQARSAMVQFYASHGATLPERVAASLIASTSIDVAPQALYEFVEAVYANKDDFTADQLLEAADIVKFTKDNGWYGLRENMRGDKMESIFRGEGVEDAPVPLPNFFFGETDPVEMPPAPELPIPEVSPPPVPEGEE